MNMEKKNYINNIIQACNKVLEYEKLVNDLGGSIEELFWDVAIPESVRDKLSEHEVELDEAEFRLQKLMFVLDGYDRKLRVKDDPNTPNIFEALYFTINSVFNSLSDLQDDIDNIKDMSSEDVLAIRSIMGQVKLLRDTLIWVSDDKTDKD